MPGQAPIPPQELGETRHEQVEYDVARRYQDVLTTAQSLNEASEVSTQQAVEVMLAVGDRFLYAKPDDEGVLVLNRHGSQYEQQEDVIAQGVAKYHKTIDRIASHGFLAPDLAKSFKRTFAVRPIEIENHSLVLSEMLEAPVRMAVSQSETSTLDTFLSFARQFGLDEQATDTLKRTAETKQRIEGNPREGSNFMYHYSPLFLEVGLSGNVVQARLGVIKTRVNDGAGLDHVSFEGVYVSVEQALAIINSNMEGYALEAEPEKTQAAEAPTAEELTQNILSQREESAKAFVEQFKEFAPEASTLTDAELLALAKVAAESSDGRGGPALEVNPVEKHIIDTMRDKDASFRIISNKDNEVDVPKQSFWDPASQLVADGRSGLVTRIDYDGDPSSFAASAKELGREVHDPEKSARLRQQMFEAKTKALAGK